MGKNEKLAKRNKPKFLRRDWHKKIKLGSKIKKKRVWRAAKGRHNKVRLCEKGYSKKPSIGWGREKEMKGKIGGFSAKRVENPKQVDKLKSKEGIIIGKVGRRKRHEILKKIKEKGYAILNKYKKLEEVK